MWHKKGEKMKYLLITLLSIFLVNCAKPESINQTRPRLVVVGETTDIDLIQQKYPDFDLILKGIGCNFDCDYNNISNYIVMFKLTSFDKILILDHTMTAYDLTQAVEYARIHGVDAEVTVSNVASTTDDI